MKVKKFVVGVVVVMAGSMLFPVAGSALPGDINESVGDGGIAVINPTDNYDRPIAVAVDSLGRTVIAGQCYNIENQADFCIGRFDQNGNPDTSFSDDGFIVIDMGEAGNYDEPFTVAIDQLNRVVVGGKCYDATGANRSDFCILRLTPSGNLDTSFGGDGKVYVDMGDTGSYDTLRAITVDSLRRVIATGWCETTDGAERDFCTMRLTPTGNLDTSFGGDGKVYTSPSHQDDAWADKAQDVAVDSLRRVIVGGRCEDDNNQHRNCLVRYTASGNLDTSFGNNGIVIQDPYLNTQGDDYFDHIDLVEIDSQNRIVTAGPCYTEGRVDGVWCVARFTTTGNLDTSFSSDGFAHTTPENSPSDYNEHIHGLVVDSYDRPIIAGGVYNGNYMAPRMYRFSENGEFNTWFGPNGDGSVDVQGSGSTSMRVPEWDVLMGGIDEKPNQILALNAYDEIMVVGRCTTDVDNPNNDPYDFCIATFDTENNWGNDNTESFFTCGTHTAHARFGEVMVVGDFNGDGVEDLAVGSPGSNIAGYAGNRHGKVTIFYGPGIVRDCQVIHQGTFNGSPDSPESWDLFGGVLASGDFNDDGFDDLAVGTPYEDLGGNNQLTNAGIVEIFNGSNQGFATAPQRIHQYSPGVQSTSETGDKFGAALATFVTDTEDHLVVGVPGEGFGWGANVKDNVGAVHIFRGAAEADGIDTNQTTWFHQDTVDMPSTNEEGDEFGASLAVDPDFPLLWVGAPGEDIGWGSNIKVDAGAVFLIAEGGFMLCQSCTTALGAFGNVSFPGASETGDRFGESLSVGTTALHMDPEIMTIAVGVPGEGLGGHPQAGMVQLMSFNSTNETVSFETLYQDRPGVNNAGEDNDRFGANVLFADLDGDTVDDLIVSVPGESIAGKANAGALAVFPIENDSWVGAASDVIFYAMQDDFSGNSIAQADFGSAMAVLEGDLIIGSPGYKIHALTDAGAIYPLDLPTASFP